MTITLTRLGTNLAVSFPFPESTKTKKGKENGDTDTEQSAVNTCDHGFILPAI